MQSDREIRPAQMVEFLAKRKAQAETVCLINWRHDNRLAWLNEFVKLVDELECDKFSVSRCAMLQVRIQWKHGSPEHVVTLFESHEEACKSAFRSVSAAASLATPGSQT